MKNLEEFLTQLSEKVKHRCVAAGIFYPEKIRNDSHTRYFAKAGIPKVVSDSYWRSKGLPTNHLSDQELIRRNIGYLFEGSRLSFKPGRFNTKSFPALYTAKGAETAKSERLHYVGETDIPFAYVVFSVTATESLVDIRSMTTSRGIPYHQASHGECQRLAEKIRSIGDEEGPGIISKSARDAKGVCCTFFSIGGLSPDTIVEANTAQFDD